MRAINITLASSKPVAFPLAYNERLQGLLYSCWRESFPELHDEGFGSRPLRLFTFSPLSGPHTIDKTAKTIRFNRMLSFEVRSPIEQLLDEVARQLTARGTARIGSHELDVINLQSCDRLLFGSRVVLRMNAPVTVYRTEEDGYTTYFSPDDPQWSSLINQNASRKASVLSIDNAPLTVIPRSETLKKVVTTFKGTRITGWLGELIASGDPRTISLLYYTGLGAKNSQGFGMFDILDERP